MENEFKIGDRVIVKNNYLNHYGKGVVVGKTQRWDIAKVVYDVAVDKDYGSGPCTFYATEPKYIKLDPDYAPPPPPGPGPRTVSATPPKLGQHTRDSIELEGGQLESMRNRRACVSITNEAMDEVGKILTAVGVEDMQYLNSNGIINDIIISHRNLEPVNPGVIAPRGTIEITEQHEDYATELHCWFKNEATHEKFLLGTAFRTEGVITSGYSSKTEQQGVTAAQGDGGDGAPKNGAIVLNGKQLTNMKRDALKIFESESNYVSEHMRESEIHKRKMRPAKVKPDGAIWYQCKVCEFQDTAAEVSRHMKQHGIDAPVLAIMKTYERV